MAARVLPAAFGRAEFKADARPEEVFLGPVSIGKVEPKEFTTGSLGWRLDTRLPVRVGKFVVLAQMSVQLVIVGSKDLPEDFGPGPAQGGQGG